jgi:signal transduction histidine kinase
MTDPETDPEGDGESGREPRYEGPEDRRGIRARGKTTKAEIKAAKEHAEMIVDTVRDGLLVLDLDLRVESANESFLRMFEVSLEETKGTLVYDLGNGQWDIPRLRKLLEEILPEKKTFNDYEIEHEFEGIGHRTMLLNARQLNHHDMILLAIEDVTERRMTERSLRELTEELESQVEERTRELRVQTTQLRRMASQLTVAEQEERRRIAQILHDQLQQQLFGIKMQLDFAEKDARAGDPDAMRHKLERIDELMNDCIAILRNLTTELSPHVLTEAGLREAIPWLIEHMSELHGLIVELEMDEGLPDQDDAVCELLYQGTRELLFNVVKHAGTLRATVAVRAAGEDVEIVAEDRGKGFDPETLTTRSTTGTGFGLFFLKERIELFGGSLRIETSPENGARITMRVPVDGGLQRDA